MDRFVGHVLICGNLRNLRLSPFGVVAVVFCSCLAVLVLLFFHRDSDAIALVAGGLDVDLARRRR